MRGTWVAQSIKHPTLNPSLSLHLMVVSSSSTLGSKLGVKPTKKKKKKKKKRNSQFVSSICIPLVNSTLSNSVGDLHEDKDIMPQVLLIQG